LRVVPGITAVTAGWAMVYFNSTCAQLWASIRLAVVRPSRECAG
jgi:hypothetical protein